MKSQVSSGHIKSFAILALVLIMPLLAAAQSSAWHKCSPVIKVFNVRGQICREYAPGSLSPGTHKWHFDGKDMRGNTLPGGVYLVRMSLPDRTVIRRITLMK
ncbi:MAG: FlgD immunoglobulin-like domain containing protein [Candidatus Cloacimonetes bacterium]|nr:FlgD immunoglobulin-like domain containing protein [Candidatus Cloacimonadota bacterium]MDD3577594.1 FlgD immunoglobulin-like domain containing protein [Candidatus Cloacimonadota bacterium]MDD4666533.1 FlgD immunoglobulin-like domain containing protein [Candidatus Cloacimonadota bacterium]